MPVKDCVKVPWKGIAPCLAERLGLSVGAASALFPLRLRLQCRHDHDYYIHQNLVRVGLAERAEDFPWSRVTHTLPFMYATGVPHHGAEP